MPVSTKIQVEGDKEYIQAMKDAKASLKLLGSELKVEKAEMDRNGKSIQACKKNYDTLKKQYDVQRKTVDEMNKRLEKLKAKYGENSREVQEYQAEVNTATAQMQRFGQQMDSAEDALNSFGSSVDSLKDKLKGGIASAASSAGEALKKVGTAAGIGFAGVAAAAVKAITEVDNLERSASAWAGSLTSQAATSGVDVETLQTWQYAASQVGVEYEEILEAMKELQKKSAEDSGIESLNYLGISENLGNTEKFFLVLQQIKSLMDAGIMTDSDAASMMDELFGDSQAMLPLLNNMEAWNKAVDDAKTSGAIVSEDDVEALNSLEKVLEKFDLLKTTLTTSIAALFAGDWNTLYTDVNNVFTSLIGMITGDADVNDVESAVNTLVANLETALGHAGEVIGTFISSLQSSDNENVKAIGDALATIRDMAISIWEHREEIKTGIEALIGLFAVGKIASCLTNIGKFASGLSSIGTALANIIKNKGASTVLGDVASAAGSTGGASVGGTLASGSSAALSLGGFGSLALGGLVAGGTISIAYAMIKSLEAGTIQAALSEEATKTFIDSAKEGAEKVFTPSETTVVEDLVNGGSDQSKAMRMALGHMLNGTPEVGTKVTAEEGEVSGEAIDEMQTDMDNAGFSAPVTPYWSSGLTWNYTTGGSGGGGGRNTKGRYAVGLDDVPYDGYEAVLHKGEAVLTKMQANKWRAGGTNANKAESMDMTAVVNAINQGMSGVTVTMDGQKVGTLVASTVSREIVKGLKV